MVSPKATANVLQLVDSVNRGDGEAFVESFLAEGVVNDRGTRYVGQAAICDWSNRKFMGSKTTLTVVSVEHGEGQITIDAEVKGGFHGLMRFTFLMARDKINEMRITED